MKSRSTKNEEMEVTYEIAYEKTQELKSFYYSLILYLIIMSGLVYIWYEFSSNNIQWFWFPIIGWGLGLVSDGLKVFNITFLFGAEWEQNKIKKYMENANQNLTNEAENVFQQDESFQQAKKKVDALKGFYGHLLVYLVVNVLIVSTIVYTTNFDVFSFGAMSTAIFWGIGLFFHALGVFGRDIFFNENWEKRQIEAFMKAKKQY